ncbi:hypothetical protein [Humisphaera borealis]|uniref:Uncharacterized protein n=1 Tax=Humisphaera borealis TaxID=2807512 RepID=A0A7M2X0P3_9BACT|nr:hypothetical protein [Humisphaera borealis]QOV91318.1 hypothetical protein IPV69_08170 [Humisphaera borealis]
MRIPRTIRWLFILIALVFGWLAGGYLQETRAEREWQQERLRQHTAPATRPDSRGGPATSPAD